jgi:Tfp pilus assembly protein PilF
MQNFGWYLCQQKRFAEATPVQPGAGVPQYRDAPRTLLRRASARPVPASWPSPRRR